MDNHEITWYMQEIAMHGLGAKIQFIKFIQCLENEETRQTRIVWSYLSSFLSHAAMISKFASPIYPSGIKKSRMEALRSILDISQDSEVLPRTARDNLEHFDERLDNWVGTKTGYLEIVFPDKATAIRSMHNGMRIKRVLALKELTFFSENRDGSRFALELEPLFEEVNRISNKAVEWLESSSPYMFIFPSDDPETIEQKSLEHRRQLEE
ncbi:hypothetical protein [Nodosilinea sp. P-1105]|uniref:hypothetical protein n=1 Tax=Nodosilinea sp. P-1105 TaxID=2546229 RepID=UPI00197F7B3B|nr:hypothetical protein [Nodosilinea sp. P-1105]